MKKLFLSIILLAAVLLVAVAPAAGYSEFSKQKSGVLFSNDIDTSQMTVEKSDDHIEISSEEHQEGKIKLKQADVENVLGNYDLLYVSHYTDNGTNDWNKIVAPNYENGYLELNVEFSTVTITPYVSQISNWNFEDWDSGTAPSDWTVVSAGGFELEQNIRYRIVITYDSQTQTEYLTPIDDEYYIFWDEDSSSLLPENQFYEVVNISVSKDLVNSTYAEIYISYNDSLDTINSVYFELGQSLDNGTFNAIDTSPTYTENCTVTFGVTDYKGESYIIKAYVDHESFGDVEKTYTVTFRGSNLPFEGKSLAYLAIIILFVVAGMFGKADASLGAIMLVGLGWFFWFLDIFESFGTATNNTMGIGLLLATAYSVLGYFNRKRDEGGI